MLLFFVSFLATFDCPRAFTLPKNAAAKGTPFPAKVCDELEFIVMHGDRHDDDLTNRMPRRGDLESAAIALTKTRRVAILTGSLCEPRPELQTETDGPLGALAVARAVSALGASATILTDECNEAVVRAAARNANFRVQICAFPGGDSWGSVEDAELRRIAQDVDHVVAVGRCGPAKDGKYYTKACHDVTSRVAPLDQLIPMAALYGVGSTGIGDSETEVGVGSAIQGPAISGSKTITCVTSTDYQIVCSVSNWGGYALAAAMAVVAAQDRRRRPEDVLARFLPTYADEYESLLRQVDAGARDSVSGQSTRLCVDGQPLEASLGVLRRLTRTASQSGAVTMAGDQDGRHILERRDVNGQEAVRGYTGGERRPSAGTKYSGGQRLTGWWGWLRNAYDSIFWYDIDFDEASTDIAGRREIRAQETSPIESPLKQYRLDPGRIDYGNTVAANNLQARGKLPQKRDEWLLDEARPRQEVRDGQTDNWGIRDTIEDDNLLTNQIWSIEEVLEVQEATVVMWQRRLESSEYQGESSVSDISERIQDLEMKQEKTRTAWRKALDSKSGDYDNENVERART